MPIGWTSVAANVEAPHRKCLGDVQIVPGLTGVAQNYDSSFEPYFARAVVEGEQAPTFVQET